MPTRGGLRTAAFAVLALIAARLFGIFELYIVAAAALGLVACAVGWVVLNWRGLQAARQVVPARLHVGGESVVTLSLTNRRIIPTPVAQITDEVDGVPRADASVPPLGRRSATRASYRVPAERRGMIELGPMRTTVTDPFGLASTRRQSAPDAAVLVLPSYDDIAPPPQPSGTVANRLDRAPGRIGPHGDDFSSLRDYVVGDDLRKVHWPSTARSGDLVVRTEHAPEHGESLVLLDVRRDMAAPEVFERMVSAATSVLIACFRRGDLVSLMTTAGDIEVADDTASFDRILDRLALVTQTTEREIEMPDRRELPPETAVMILGTALDAVDRMSILPGHRTRSLVFRFTSSATPSFDEAAVPSRRMATLGPHDDFAATWATVLGVPHRPAPATRS